MASRSRADSGPTNSLERGFALLDLLRTRPKGLTHAELCRLLNLPSSTCTYITTRLERSAYLTRDPESRRFRLGLKTISLARTALLGLGFRSIAEPVLYRITSETGLSAGIGVRQGARVLLVDHLDGPDVVTGVIDTRKRRVEARENRDIGRELPFHTTALGKVLLASMSDPELDALLPQIPQPNRSLGLKLNDRAALRRQLALIRKRGFAEAEGEYYASLRALAVPIRDSAGVTGAALSLNGHPDSPVWHDPPALVALAQSAARDIARDSTFTYVAPLTPPETA